MQLISYKRLRVTYWVGHMEVTGNNTVSHFWWRRRYKAPARANSRENKDEVGAAPLENSITEISEKRTRDGGQYPKGKPGQSEGFCK